MALWSFVWRLTLVFMPVLVGLTVPFIATVMVFRVDKLIPDQVGKPTSLLLWLFLGMIVAATVLLTSAWPMRRTLERNIPGLIWRVGWQDTGFMLWSFMWRVYAVGIAASVLIWWLAKQSAAIDDLVQPLTGWALDVSLFLELCVFAWAMRAALRIQFRRSLRQGRIQGSTGVIEVGGGGGRRVAPREVSRLHVSGPRTGQASAAIGWGGTFRTLWSIWWRTVVVATPPVLLWYGACYLLFVALGLNPDPNLGEPLEFLALFVLSIAGVGAWFWLAARAFRGGIEANISGLDNRLSWADAGAVFRGWLWRLVLVHNGAFLLLWFSGADHREDPWMIPCWLGISTLGAVWAFRVALRIQFRELLGRGLIETNS